MTSVHSPADGGGRPFLGGTPGSGGSCCSSCPVISAYLAGTCPGLSRLQMPLALLHSHKLHVAVETDDYLPCACSPKDAAGNISDSQGIFHQISCIAMQATRRLVDERRIVIGNLLILLCTLISRVHCALYPSLWSPCWFRLAPGRVSDGARPFKRESLQSPGSSAADVHMEPLLETSTPKDIRSQSMCVQGAASRSGQKLHLQDPRWTGPDSNLLEVLPKDWQSACQGTENPHGARAQERPPVQTVTDWGDRPHGHKPTGISNRAGPVCEHQAGPSCW